MSMRTSSSYSFFLKREPKDDSGLHLKGLIGTVLIVCISAYRVGSWIETRPE